MSAHQHVDDPARIHVRGVERGLDLHLDAEAACHAREHRIRLPPPVRHRLQQRGDEAQGRAAPEIREPEHVEGHEPAARAPDLLPELPDEMGLADAGLPDEHAPLRTVGRRPRLALQLGDDLRGEPLVRTAGRRRVDPDAVERAHPVEIDPAQGVEGIAHDWIQMMWKGSPAGLKPPRARRDRAIWDR
jgi:hypothetical protein